MKTTIMVMHLVLMEIIVLMFRIVLLSIIQLLRAILTTDEDRGNDNDDLINKVANDDDDDTINRVNNLPMMIRTMVLMNGIYLY